MDYKAWKKLKQIHAHGQGLTGVSWFLPFLNRHVTSTSRCFVWLFNCLGFIVLFENSSLIWRRHHCFEGLQILIYARHSRSLSSEGSLACYTYCDMGHLFIMVISEDSWHSDLLPSVWQWSCHYLFLRLRSVAAGIQTPNLPLSGLTLSPTAPPPQFHAGLCRVWVNKNTYMYEGWPRKTRIF